MKPDILRLDAFPQPPLIRLNYPVVLMHGFGMVAAFGRKGHLHGEAMNLRSCGVWAYAPNVQPYGTIAERAEEWHGRLRNVLRETGASHVHLIAQSMGGLDARSLVSNLGGHEYVKTLTTVSTPHRGSSLASIALDQPRLLTKWLAYLAEAAGAAALGGGRPTAGNFIEALRELTPASLANDFNPGTPDHPEVSYFSYTGKAGKGTDIPISPILLPLNRMLFKREGVNDGFVTPESAAWGVVLGAVEADHTAQIGLNLSPTSDFDSRLFYRKVIEQLS